MKHGIEWAAGFFEGEGCISWAGGKDRGGMGLDMAQVDPLPLEWFHQAVGGLGKIYGPYLTSGQAARGWAPKYFWRCRKAAEVRAVLELLLPYLTPRRQEAARLMLERYDQRPVLTYERRVANGYKMWETRRARYGPTGHKEKS